MSAKELRDQVVKLVQQYDRESEGDKPELNQYPYAELVDGLACGLALFAVEHNWKIRGSLDAFEHAFKIRYDQVMDGGWIPKK